MNGVLMEFTIVLQFWDLYIKLPCFSLHCKLSGPYMFTVVLNNLALAAALQPSVAALDSFMKQVEGKHIKVNG